MKLREEHMDLLRRALLSSSGASERWDKTPKIDDETLRVRIAEEFGIQGGFNKAGLGINYHGGSNPRVIIEVGGEPPFILMGRDLLTAARETLGLSRPGELF